MHCVICRRHLNKSASPSLVIGPVCLRKAMPRPKRIPKPKGSAVVSAGQLRLALDEGVMA